MSQENVEIVREVMTLLDVAPGGVDEDVFARLAVLIAPDVHLDMSRRVFNPDTYDGFEGLQRLAGEIQSVWSEFTITPERFVDAGDRVVVIERRRGRGRGSGVTVDQRSGVIWTLRDGQVVRMETDLPLEEALKAVGLDE